MIYTGYYAKLKQYQEEGLQPLSIAGRAPAFYTGPEYKFLAPNYHMFMSWKKGKIDNDEYTRQYNEYLNSIDVNNVLRTINAMGENVVLLCYEKPGDFCHRHLVAEWLTNMTGMPVEEYELGTIANEKSAIECLKQYYLTVEEITEEFNIKDPEDLLNRLISNPPDGTLLIREVQDGDIVYSLEDAKTYLEEMLDK